MSHVICTIGYEAATLPDVIDKLHAAKVEILLDIRAVASSRRAGFSKTLLRESLEAEGIAYEHLRALGTPKAGREAARKGRIAEMERIYTAHMETAEAQYGLARATAIASEQKSALLCYEASALGCHRRIVADLIGSATGYKIQHL